MSRLDVDISRGGAVDVVPRYTSSNSGGSGGSDPIGIRELSPGADVVIVSPPSKRMHSLPHSSVSPIGSPSNQDFAYSPISPYSSYLPTTPHNSFTNPALLPSSPATFLTSLTTLTNLVPRPDSSSFDSSSTISYNLFSPWGDKPAWRVVSNAGGSSSAPTTNPSPPLAHTHHGGNGTASELNDPWMDDFFLSMGGLELESPSPGPLSSTQPQQSSQARPHRYSPLPMPMPDSTPSPYVSSRRGSIPAPQSPIYPTGFISSSAPPIAPRMTTTSGTFPLPAPIGALPSTQQPFPVRSPPTSPPRKRTGPSSPNTGRRNKSKQHSVSYHGNESTFHSIPPINARSPPYAHSNGNRFQAMSPQRSRGKSGRSRRMSHDNGTETAHSFGVGANGGGGGGGNNSRKNTRGRDDQDLSRFDIDIDRVNAGLDKRTTLMIKNIPNKYDQSMLLETLDRSFSRTYDFFYLPIDFKNKCNVGYAFINFISPLSIPKVMAEFNHSTWERFNSEKVCKVSYARIQGKLAFIEHFRNSSLMHEDISCRPLIFYSSGENTGLPEPFPAANVPRTGPPTR